MKRRRAVMEGHRSDISCVIEELSKNIKLKTDNEGVSIIPAKPFLQGCKLLIQVLDKIGPTMAVLRQVIHQNIQRLEKVMESDMIIYSNLAEILKKEQKEGNARSPTSCTRALVWLTRSMDFTVALLERLVKDPALHMEKAVEEAYEITMKPWHGWISTAAYKVALKLVPEGKIFMSLLMPKDGDYEMLKEELLIFISLLVPILNEMHCILRTFRADRLKST